MPEPELINEPAVTCEVGTLEVFEEPPAPADHHQQPAAPVVVLGMIAEMLRERVDPLGEQRHLHARRAGVARLRAVLLDNRLLREELRRAAVERRPAVASRPHEYKASPAERKLLRAFLEDQAVMDELLPALVADGLLNGMVAEDVFLKLLEVRNAGGLVDVHSLGENLSADNQHLLHESLLASEEIPGREDAIRFCNALRRRKIERELSALNPAIDAAGREQDWARLADLNQSKVHLMQELARIRENSEIENKTSTKSYSITSN